jgi:hypothetical protein
MHILHAHPACHSSTWSPASLLPGWVMRYWPILARLCVTLGMLTIIRLGYFIPVPGVDMARMPAAVGGQEGK